MGNPKLRGKDLRKINYTSNKSISLAIDIMQEHYKYSDKNERLKILDKLRCKPEQFTDHKHLSKLAKLFIGKTEQASVKPGSINFELNTSPKEFAVYGKKGIDEPTMNQMYTAMKLPVTVAGALMPDAHLGYGLPIGGVLATDNAVIPYGVGNDIGCRMALSIFGVKPTYMQRHTHAFAKALDENTFFGIGNNSSPKTGHEVLDREEFRLMDFLRPLHGKAAMQLGSSGSGNHFVEFGAVNLGENNALGLPAGEYVGLLSHSGSRGLGADIAAKYTKIAMQQCRIDRVAQHLAWLDLNSEAGQEYWLAMNLAGDYAKANHDIIHYRLAKALKLKALAKIENHHNFAWKEMHQGRELIVHRKGATPASVGELGIIPGSMATSAFIVSGRGKADSLASASHGAGRKMSRSAAKQSITASSLKKLLKNEGITLMGGAPDESPMAYKDIHQVIESQHDLVNIEGVFNPKIVKMA